MLIDEDKMHVKPYWFKLFKTAQGYVVFLLLFSEGLGRPDGRLWEQGILSAKLTRLHFYY